MEDKHIASSGEISQTLLEMRSSRIEDMILTWNEISIKWSVDSVSQVHRSLQCSGHIQEMIQHIIENKKLSEEVAS